MRRFEKLAATPVNGNGNGNGNGSSNGGSVRSVEELCEALATFTSDDRSDARLEALEALVAMGAPDAPVQLVDRLMTRPGGSTPADRDMLRRLAEATDGGMERATSHLVSLLGTGANDSRAVTMLTWLAPESVQPVIDALDEPAKQQLAAVALGYMRDERAADALRPLMLESPYPATRRAAAWALGKIGDPETGRALLGAATDPPAEEQLPPDLEQAPSLAPESLRSLDFDGLAELYEIAVEAWHAADRADDEHESERWRVTVKAIVDEARRRPAPGEADQDGSGRRFVSRRRDRRRARLLAACAATPSGA